MNCDLKQDDFDAMKFTSLYYLKRAIFLLHTWLLSIHIKLTIPLLKSLQALHYREYENNPTQNSNTFIWSSVHTLNAFTWYYKIFTNYFQSCNISAPLNNYMVNHSSQDTRGIANSATPWLHLLLYTFTVCILLHKFPLEDRFE